MLILISYGFSTTRKLNKIVPLFSIKTNLAHCKLQEIRNETIEMLKFFTFPRSLANNALRS